MFIKYIMSVTGIVILIFFFIIAFMAILFGSSYSLNIFSSIMENKQHGGGKKDKYSKYVVFIGLLGFTTLVYKEYM